MESGSRRVAQPGPILTPAERVRLVGILGRLGSDFDGERAAAGLLATRLLRDRRLTWDDVVATPREAEPARSARNVRTSPEDDLDLCGRHATHLGRWQAHFVGSLAAWLTPWSPSQIAKLAQIADDLRARGFE